MKRMILIGVPHHGNLGDHAIALAEEEMIKRYFKNYNLLQIPEETIKQCVNRAQKFINNDDIILLQGGGNMGDRYIVPEDGRREVMKLFPNNKIIIFPQTSYFSCSEKGKKELELSKKVYNAHKNLVIMAREKKSYNFMREHFYNANVYLTPDIVMTMYKPLDKERRGATLLFRGDKEKVLKNDNTEKIRNIINKKYDIVKSTDTHLGEDVINISGKIRDEALNAKFNEFQTSEVVVTDRLHGMIFSAITETPCIAFKSMDHKVIESYEWFKNLEYIQICDKIDDFENILKKVTNVKNRKYNNEFAEKTISDILKKEICQ